MKATPRSTKNSHWTERSACGGMEEKYFSYQTPADSGYTPERGLRSDTGRKTILGVRETNKVRLQKGAKVCDSCPVRQECLDDADASDMHWTIRGGYFPTVLHPEKSTPPVKNMTDLIRNLEPWSCKNGHGRKYMLFRKQKKLGVRPYCGYCNDPSRYKD